MKKKQLAWFLLISIVASILLSILSFFCLRIINESSTFSHRQEYLTNLAKDFEGKNSAQAMLEFNQKHSGQHGSRSQYWLLNKNGEIQASSAGQELPILWSEILKPESPHEFTTTYKKFSLIPDLTLIRLTGEPAMYLLSKALIRRAPNQMIIAQVTLTFVIIATTLFLALSITFLYLQRKSVEAKEILNRLERGDLTARFEIQGFDEAGSLMLDFNRMASQIEFLVHKVQATERMRRELLQELSHDLRTPLTSLSTSLETLHTHTEELSKVDRGELLAMMRGELEYFIQLLEDLFFISEIDEPNYQSHLSEIDLAKLLEAELKSRETLASGKLKWSFEDSSTQKSFKGDQQSLLRLIKNLLDNAARFAESNVKVHLRNSADAVLLEVQDDGPGMSRIEIESFGERRKHRSLSKSSNFKSSLGLGSVIIKKIVQFYKGEIEILNLREQGINSNGTLIRIYLKVGGISEIATR